jgi:hypothetical protein
MSYELNKRAGYLNTRQNKNPIENLYFQWDFV